MQHTIISADDLIHHAIQLSASDIHIEPHENDCRIRYRRDGILHEMTEISNLLANRLITRLKVLAKLDISEHRLPQDGRFRENGFDFRINTCPVLFGEKVVLRLQSSDSFSFSIDNLGMTEQQQNIFQQALSKPQGMILVTGPTGSGKTVTLYSALHYLNTSDKNILTAEDPVEIKLPKINQVPINPKIGFHFSTALRTFLRQDPDIIMVGEIRDIETAEMALLAAQTGHLVLSTLHTNNAIETLTRLLSMGIPSYPIASSITLIIAQRLVRKLCEHCKQAENIPLSSILPHTLNQHAIITVFRAASCDHCSQGYQGRTGIYEVLPITEKITQSILANANAKEIAAAIRQTGWLSLQDHGLNAVVNGITSLFELNRVMHL